MPGIGILVGTLAVAVRAQQQPLRLELTTTIRSGDRPFLSAAFSPNGQRLAAGSDVGQLHMLDAISLEERWTRSASDSGIRLVVFSPDSSRVACCGSELAIFDSFMPAELARLTVECSCFAWFPDNKRFVYGVDNLLHVAYGSATTTTIRFDAAVRSVVVGRDESLSVRDELGREWRVAPRTAKPELHVPDRRDADATTAVRQVAGNHPLAMTPHGPLRRDGASRARFADFGAFAMSADGQSFAVSGLSRTNQPAAARDTVRWWFDGGAQFEDLPQQANVAALALAPDGKQLFVATADGKKALLRRDRGPLPMSSRVIELDRFTISPDGMAVAVNGRSWELHFLDGRPPRTLREAFDVQRGRSGGELLVRYAKHVELLDTRTGKTVRKAPLPPRVAPPRDHHLEPALIGPGDCLCIGGELVDYEGNLVLALPGPAALHSFGEIAFAADGHWLLAHRRFDHRQGGLVLATAAGTDARLVDSCDVRSCAFTPDGRKIYYVCGDDDLQRGGRLRIRDTASLQLERELEGIDRWDLLDATHALVSAGGQLQVWDVAKLAPLQSLTAPTAPPQDYQLSADRRTMIVPHCDMDHVRIESIEIYRLTMH